MGRKKHPKVELVGLKGLRKRVKEIMKRKKKMRERFRNLSKKRR
jgi:hypothetical protein